MTSSINNTGDGLFDATDRAVGNLPAGTDGRPQVPGVDPRLTAAVGDTSEDGRKGRNQVLDRVDKTGKYTRGLQGIDDEGGRNVKGVSSGNSLGRSSMPTMPSVPPSPAQSAPPFAAAPAPMVAPTSMPAASVPAPTGVSIIDPKLLQVLVTLSQAQADKEAAAGLTPHLRGDPWSSNAATTPQNRQPLDVSQVSLEKYPGGPLSEAETASVIDQALTINGVANDPQLRAEWQELYQHMAMGESSRYPNQANNDDRNATGPMMEDGAHSNSSRGMWQTVPSTFAAYHMGGTSTSIYDPIASAAASMNYVMHTYHVSPDGIGLANFATARGVGTSGYTGY